MFIYMYINVVVSISLFVYQTLSIFVFCKVFCSITILVVYLNIAGEPNHTLYRRIISYMRQYDIPLKQQVWQQSITCFNERQRFNLLYISVDITSCIFFSHRNTPINHTNLGCQSTSSNNKHTPFHTVNLMLQCTCHFYTYVLSVCVNYIKM